jgi:hypothetical protein
MTENEFLRQVWRPYDTVEIDGGMKGRVTSVCFPSRSCKVTISQEVHEWFKCDMIVSHTSAAGATEDVAIIQELHDKLMAANKRNDDLQDIVTELKMRVNGDAKQEELRKIRKASNKIFDAMNSIDSKLRHIDEYLTNLGVTEEE